MVEVVPAAVGGILEFLRGADRERAAAGGVRVGRRDSARCEARGLGLDAVSPLHVAAYIRTHPGSAPTVKQYLAPVPVLSPAEARKLLDQRRYHFRRRGLVGRGIR